MSQILRPDADINTAWHASAVGDCFSCIDETTADDADYIWANADSYQEVGLTAPGETPGSGNCTLRVRASRVMEAEGTVLTVTTRMGGTVVDTATYNALAFTMATLEKTIASSAFTDWTDIRVRFAVSLGGKTELFKVSWCELEVPDASAAVMVGLEMGMMF